MSVALFPNNEAYQKQAVKHIQLMLEAGALPSEIQRILNDMKVVARGSEHVLIDAVRKLKRIVLKEGIRRRGFDPNADLGNYSQAYREAYATYWLHHYDLNAKEHFS